MTDSETLDPELERLRNRWEHGRKHWHIWRSTTLDPITREETLGDWCATRLSPDAGPDLTVIADTADALDASLTDQARRAANGIQPLTIAELFKE